MKFSLVAFLSLPALAAAAGTTIHEKIIDEKRHIVFNSRRLSDECLPICVEKPEVAVVTEAPTKAPTKNPTDSPTKAPTKNPTDSPTKTPTKNPTPFPTEAEIQVQECPVAETPKCVNDVDCIRPDFPMNCPSCVNEVCVDKPYTGKGNLNCCKRTPGNDLVITNGCGANNICFGFNDHDQCEVNQHAAYCNPTCWSGNLDENLENPSWDKCRDYYGKAVTIDNDQGSKSVPKIYPMEYCMNTNIYWKQRSKGDVEPPMESNPEFSASAKPVEPDLSSLGTECEPPKEPECVYDIDCLDHPNHDPMFCPTCEGGMCVAKPYDGNGNLNCCKRTPGNDLVITNGCGANNICWGFHDDDQCEVNQHAAYCHPSCPEGNVDLQTGEIIEGACDPGMVDPHNGITNNQGSAGLPRVFPMWYCSCTDVKWKTSTAFDIIPESCNHANSALPDVEYVEVADSGITPPPTPFCPSGKLSIQCGKDVMTCGMGGSTGICSAQSPSNQGGIIAIDSRSGYTSDFEFLCDEIMALLQVDFDNHGFGVSGEDIKCNEYKQGSKWVNEKLTNFACYDQTGIKKKWDWVEGETLQDFVTC